MDCSTTIRGNCMLRVMHFFACGMTFTNRWYCISAEKSEYSSGCGVDLSRIVPDSRSHDDTLNCGSYLDIVICKLDRLNTFS